MRKHAKEHGRLLHAFIDDIYSVHGTLGYIRPESKPYQLAMYQTIMSQIISRTFFYVLRSP